MHRPEDEPRYPKRPPRRRTRAVADGRNLGPPMTPQDLLIALRNGLQLSHDEILDALALGADRVESGAVAAPELTEDERALLIEQADHEVHRLDKLVVLTNRQRLCVGQCHLKLAGQFVHSHGNKS